MLRLIHCADLHLGSKMTAKLPKEKADERKAELRASFARMLDYAESAGVKGVIIAGDAFDSDRPLKQDKTYFYSVIRNHPAIDFFYLRGNHDREESYEELDLPNLKTFSAAWKSYCYGCVKISGTELCAENALSAYSSLTLKKDEKNIVVLHGELSNGAGRCGINLNKLRGKHIDYLALGHIHSYAEGSIDERGRYAFSGCLEGRGFDETGEKGFVLLETDETTPYGGIKSRFIPWSTRVIREEKVDITGARDCFEACQRVRAHIRAEKKDLCLIRVTGEIAFDNESLAADLEKYLAGAYYFLSVKDETARKFDLAALAGDLSLKGEFLRGVLNDSTLSEREKSKIISLGLKALSGREV